MKTRPKFIAGLVLAYLISFAYHSEADELQDLQQNMVFIYGMCAASNAIVAVRMDDHLLAQEIFTEVARGYAARLQPGVAERTAKALQAEYNSGATSWEELVNFSQKCGMEFDEYEAMWHVAFPK